MDADEPTIVVEPTVFITEGGMAEMFEDWNRRVEEGRPTPLYVSRDVYDSLKGVTSVDVAE